MWSIFPAVSEDRQLKAVLSTGSGLICHLAPLVLALSTSQRSSISFFEFLKVYSAECCHQLAVESLSMTASLNSRFVHQDVAPCKWTCKKRDWTRRFTSDLITQATVTARRRWNIGQFAHSNMSLSTPTCLHSKFWSWKKCNTVSVLCCCRFITALTASNKDANCICTC